MKRKGAISLCLRVRIAAELRDVREEGAVRRAIRQLDHDGRLQRERAETQDGFRVEPGVLIMKMDRERLPVRDRGELGDLIHRMEHDSKLSHGKSSCNGLYNRIDIRYNIDKKQEKCWDRILFYPV